jgi:hypothetical protein
MYMQIEPKAKKAEPENVISYQAFKDWVETSIREPELQLLQKYHATKELAKNGLLEVYVNAPVRFLPEGLARLIDVCGSIGDKFTTILCEAGTVEEVSLELLDLLSQASNVESIWVYPLCDSRREVFRRAARLQSKKKVKVERGALEHLEDFFEGALETLDLFESQARMMMLFAMMETPREKKFLREIINPKLLYENLTTLQRMHLIEEVSSGVYGLSGNGENLMREYVLFLDKIRRTMMEFQAYRQR